MNETDRLLAALAEPLERARAENRRQHSLAYRQSLQLLRALRLSPTLETCESILQNPSSVPVSKLDPIWAKAYGIA